MKSITIKNESFEGVPQITGFTISFNDEAKEASIFSLYEDVSSKLISRKEVEEFWNKLMELNLQKILQENEEWQGMDGYYSIVELSVGLQTLTLRLWCPNNGFYKSENLTESLKLIDLVFEIMDFAAANEIAKDFEF